MLSVSAAVAVAGSSFLQNLLPAVVSMISAVMESMKAVLLNPLELKLSNHRFLGA